MRDHRTIRLTVKTFLDDDPGYEAWYRDHHGDYALNVNPDDSRAPGMTTLHRIPCWHIGPWVSPATYRLTKHAKVTGNHREALWRLAPVFGFPQHACRHCGVWNEEPPRPGKEPATQSRTTREESPT